MHSSLCHFCKTTQNLFIDFVGINRERDSNHSVVCFSETGIHTPEKYVFSQVLNMAAGAGETHPHGKIFISSKTLLEKVRNSGKQARTTYPNCYVNINSLVTQIYI